MTQQTDLDAALSTLSSSIDELIAKSNSAGTPTDLSTEIATVASIQSKVDAALNPPQGNGSGGVTIQPGQ